MPADGTIDFVTARMAAKSAERRSLTLVHDAGHPQANIGTHGFRPVEPITSEAPPSRFMPAEDEGAVYIGTVRFDRYQVAALAALFSREAARSGDWGLYDQLNAARDGFAPEPPDAA